MSWSDIAKSMLQPAMLVGGAVCLGFLGLLAILAFHPIPQANHDAMMLMLGALGGSFTTLVAFYFGSSSSSKLKDDTIKKMTNAASGGQM